MLARIAPDILAIRKFLALISWRMFGIFQPMQLALVRIADAVPAFAFADENLVPESHRDLMHKSLVETDPDVAEIMAKEIKRQKESILLIASENVTSKAVFDALGSPMSNKYSEGYPGARYYGGNEHIDEIELTCQRRALEVFRLDREKWGVNVQCLSGSPANLQVYQAIMRPHDRLMGLDLPHGGHLSHGYQTPTRKISAVSTYFETFPYRVNLETGIIDYDRLEENALMYRPKVLVAGTSAYCREIAYKMMRSLSKL